MKKFFTIVAVALIIFGTLPVQHIFAESSVPSGYSPAGASDQVDAFKYYCKSRNLAIEGSVLDAVTTVTSSIYQKAVSGAGFDINELQNEIYKSTGTGQQFFYTVSGIDAMNRIFAEFLQNEDLEVGDTVDDKNLYSGELFTIDDGSTCLVYSDNVNATSYFQNVSMVTLNKGSKLKYNGSDITSMISVGNFYNAEFTINGNLYKGNLTQISKLSNGLGVSYINSPTSTFYNWQEDNILTNYDKYHPNYSTVNNIQGEFCIFHNLRDNKYFVGFIGLNYGSSTYNSIQSGHYEFRGLEIVANDEDKVPANVYLTTNNTTINNNTYEGDIIIKSDGQTEKPSPTPTPTPDPESPDNPTWGDPNSPGGNIWSTDDDGVLNFPKINLPDLNIDWSLKNITHKFPFCIPFDIVAFCSVLSAEPEAPKVQGSIPMGNWYTWVIDVDFSNYDSAAQIIRTVEVFGFVITLIYITIKLVKG